MNDSSQAHLRKCLELLETQGKADHSVLSTYPAAIKISTGDLSGLAFAVKDTFDVAGHRASLGLAPSPRSIAQSSAQVIQVLEENGATCLASTNLDELCAMYWGCNRYFGDMHNPLDASRSALGSSTGSAICVAKSYVDFSLGTDFGGSIRAPAAACGIFGLKLQRHTVPDSGAFLFSERMDSIGIFTRCASLLRTLLEALGQGTNKTRNERAHVLIPHETELTCLAPEVRAHFCKLCENLARHASIASLPPMYERALEIRKVLATRDMNEALSKLSLPISLLPEAALAVMKRAKQQSMADIKKAELERSVLEEALTVQLKKDTVLVTPTLPLLPPLLSDREKKSVPLNYFLALANVCDLPALSVPDARALVGKLPLAYQVIGLHPLRLVDFSEEFLSKDL